MVRYDFYLDINNVLYIITLYINLFLMKKFGATVLFLEMVKGLGSINVSALKEHAYNPLSNSVEYTLHITKILFFFK